MYMKAIQVTFDDALLRKLDADQEVREFGRSEVLRRAATEYLRRKRRASIAAAYRKGYGHAAGLGEEFAGWDDEGKWPEK
jgi:metal-responsive CopG/Arc/MetJ family transcriptional regulator